LQIDERPIFKAEAANWRKGGGSGILWEVPFSTRRICFELKILTDKQMASIPSDPQSATPGGKRPRGLVRAKLLDTAEQMFSKHGLEGVSLREIAAAAGQGNVGAVNYYFKDRQGLVDALVDDRVGAIEAGRHSLIDAIADLGKCDTEQLLEIFWRPVIELCRHRRGSWFIQFHLHYLLLQENVKHPFVTFPDRYPASGMLLARLQAQSAHLAPPQFRHRLGLIFMTFWGALARHETDADQDWENDDPLAEPIKMAIAALAAPV
jgi:AcrR family transcriptional regulator